jgi:N-acetylglutamate synthase-like GNAT family acetyltransferase
LPAPSSRLPATSPAGFRIRAARRGDAEGIANLVRELGYPATDLSTVNWVISHPEMEIIIASDLVDKPIGMLSLSHRPQVRMKGRILTIDELVVTAAWRKKGVGKGLLKKAIERAKVLSVKRVQLVIDKTQLAPLLPFFIAAGLKESGDSVLRLGEVDFELKP